MASISRRKLAGKGMSSSSPQTSTISSTEVAGARSFWKEMLYLGIRARNRMDQTSKKRNKTYPTVPLNAMVDPEK